MIAGPLLVADAGAQEVSFTTNSRNALSFFKAGVELWDNLYQEAAAEQFQKAVEIDPRFAMAYVYLSRTAADYHGYRENLDRAIELRVEVSEGERLIIDAYQARDENRPADEEKLLKRLEALYPGDVATHYHLAEVFFTNRDYDSAIRELERANEIDDEFPPAYNLLGYSYAFDGDYDSAIRVLDEYAELIPDEPNPHDSLGEVLLMAGRFAASISKYADAVAIDPEFYSAYGGQGHAHLFMGEVDKAMAKYDEMYALAPNDVVRRDARRWQAIANITSGKSGEAVKALRAIKSDAAGAGELLASCNRSLDVAWTLLSTGAHDEAIAELEDGWQTMMGSDLPESVKQGFARRYHVAAGAVAAGNGNLERARAEADRVRRIAELSEDLRDWEDYNWLVGEIHFADEDYRAAVANLLQAADDNPRVLAMLAESHRKRGNATHAKAYEHKLQNLNRPSLLLATTSLATKL
jgi:tetratricopeptide (TPR) repeat protein